MDLKKSAIFMAIGFLFIGIGVLFLCFLTRVPEHSPVHPDLGDIYHPEHSSLYPQQEKKKLKVNAAIEKRLQKRKSYLGVLAAKEDIKLYAPENGRWRLMVKKGDQIKKGGILGEMRNEKRTKSFERQKAVFREEIFGQKLNIEMAQEDIVRLEKEVEERRDIAQEAEYLYAEAQIDYDEGLIDERFLGAKKEELERCQMHIEDSQAMLETKFKEIDDYQDRIEELEAMVNQLTDCLPIKAPFDGFVSELFIESDQIIDRKTPILELMSNRLLSIWVDNKLPFSFDGKKVKIAFEDQTSDPLDLYMGTMQIKHFKSSGNQAGGKTLVKVILEQSLQDSFYETGKKVTLFFN